MKCEECGTKLTTTAKYCSGACRQRAYRKRARDVVPASPRLDTFAGRTTELAEVTTLLARNRIVTVTGPPGVGKSRLVHEVIANRQHVLLLELADVTRVPDLLADAPRPGLLVLDGCEHVLAGCAHLIAAHPSLRVLATSHEPLHVPGEQVYRLKPLGARDAKRLFVDRAVALDSEFDGNAALLDVVCARLDRLPLALELAARLVRVLTLEEIVARLDDRFAVLTTGPRDAPAHHRSLRAAFDRGYELLTEAEKVALHRFALVPGTVGQEMAERLRSRSLLEPDFTMLESVRQFALPGVSVTTARPQAEPEEAALSWRDERLLRVAAMVAEGLTNKQIADGLHVSLRTVEADVRDLKSVLGVRSRAQIAAWTTRA
ncbi:ATPase [Lentzea albidocapillata subsp. violacea]|uniref:ATPase n=1 Tax=Lentzea albidocapillata subsp. violacea TaxID=128104 RepID=A0A1G9TR27_9PSEU|nr:LuxR C-terminal-related transcriptional regulator [Lentzea albidocapillata]SDM50081.1 ATPase [Lentzea albidocapillata subsp. violacea]